MAESTASSELIEVVHHEHDHLLKLFDDIGQTFEGLVGDSPGGGLHDETVDMAGDDLAMALDEMLHHFNQEEEVFFVEIEQRFPELSDDIARLASAHELMCDRTRWLHRQLNQPRQTIDEHADEILKVVNQMGQLLRQHTTNETRLFETVLEDMTPDRRNSLLDEMRRL